MEGSVPHQSSQAFVEEQLLLTSLPRKPPASSLQHGIKLSKHMFLVDQPTWFISISLPAHQFGAFSFLFSNLKIPGWIVIVLFFRQLTEDIYSYPSSILAQAFPKYIC